MEIREAQLVVKNHLASIGYDKIETEPWHAFLHLIEELGEVSRTLLYKYTDRGLINNTTEPESLEDELADIQWQLFKLSSYLDLDLEQVFLNKYEKNKLKNK